jgi:hypothetical protein
MIIAAWTARAAAAGPVAWLLGDHAGQTSAEQMFSTGKACRSFPVFGNGRTVSLPAAAAAGEPVTRSRAWRRTRTCQYAYRVAVHRPSLNQRYLYRSSAGDKWHQH